MSDQINLSSAQVDNFKSVWLELLKKKISIIYDISNCKNVDFLELLEEFVPEAFEYKSTWEDLYIIRDKPKIKKDNNLRNKDTQKKKLTFGKKSEKKKISIKKNSKSLTLKKKKKIKLGISKTSS